ncbi:hypothetical protein IC575_005689 [Cucumis melo]
MRGLSINAPDYGPLPPDAPWCQASFDHEGLLSTVIVFLSCLVGLHYGNMIVHFKVRETVQLTLHLLH